MSNKSVPVVIYTSNTCGYCHAAKDFLQSIHIDYTEKNVSTDPEARKELIKKGFMGVPVIVVGEQTIQGFDKTKLENVLREAGIYECSCKDS